MSPFVRLLLFMSHSIYLFVSLCLSLTVSSCSFVCFFCLSLTVSFYSFGCLFLSFCCLLRLVFLSLSFVSFCLPFLCLSAYVCCCYFHLLLFYLSAAALFICCCSVYISLLCLFVAVVFTCCCFCCALLLLLCCSFAADANVSQARSYAGP